MFPAEFNVSLIAICIAAAFFLILLIWHVCGDYGLFNSHKGIGDRRQRHQKAILNLQIAEKISICVHPKVSAAPVVLCVSEPEQNSGPPSFAFRQQRLCSIQEDSENIESIQVCPVD